MRNLFRGYYKPTPEEIDAVWKECIFSFDANMLLNIHRYSSKTRERFLGILDKLEQRTWVSHQAAYEYHKNRLAVISQQLTPYSELQSLVEKEFSSLLEKIQEILNKYSKRHSFNDYVRTEQVTQPIERAHTEIKNILTSASGKCLSLDAHNEFHERLADLFEQKTGSPYSKGDLEKIYSEAKKRFEAKLPPGYRDSQGNKKKDPPDCYGDVVVWLQLIDYAKSQQKPIVFVTDEDGEDWWLEYRGQKQGPRPELVQEMWNEAEVPFYLYTGDRFLDYAEKFLKLPNEPDVVVEAGEIRRENTASRLLTKQEYQASELGFLDVQTEDVQIDAVLRLLDTELLKLEAEMSGLSNAPFSVRRSHQHRMEKLKLEKVRLLARCHRNELELEKARLLEIFFKDKGQDTNPDVPEN